jgi:hypothetical protein
VIKKSKISVAVVIIALMAGIAWGIWQAFRYDHIVTEIRARGEPTTLKDLDEYYPAVPPDRNAAPLYLDAAASLVQPSESANVPYFTDLRAKDVDSPLSDDQKRDITSLLSKNEETLKIIGNAAQFTESRYEFSFTDPEPPHLLAVRNLARLSAVAAICAADSGDHAAAVAHMEKSLATAQSLKSEPYLLSQLARCISMSYGLDASNYVINRNQLAKDQLRDLQEYLQNCQDLDIRRALVTQRCLALTSSETEDLFGTNRRFFTPTARRMMGNPYDIKIQLLQFEELLRIETLPSRPRRLALVGFTAAYNPDPNAWENLLHPTAAYRAIALHRFVNARDCYLAKVRLTYTGVAMERYRRANGSLPTEISALVPSYLDSVPEDPFSAIALRYVPSADGVMIYSIGPDLKDQKGVEGKSMLDGDLVFRIKN